MRSSPFTDVQRNSPGYSAFDLSHSKLLTCDMGQLIPVLSIEVVPGDRWEISNETVVRMMPLVAPVLHEIDIYTHYFFVPYRLLWDDWDDFITRGVDGDDASVLPRWSPTDNAVGSLWDYLGFPTGIVPNGALPLTFPRDAYNFCWNEFYRDETNQDEVARSSEAVLRRCWTKDYFTSALPWQQRGTAPALPISGTSHAVWNLANFANSILDNQLLIQTSSPLAQIGNAGVGSPNYGNVNLQTVFNNNTVDLGSGTSVDISDLRTAFQLQKFLERNARGGARYVEWLQVHFDVSPRDDRLQRPEYIGGTKSPIIVSEVLQTSQTDTSPQGNMAGHGISVGQEHAGKYHAKEYGMILGIMSIVPKPMYQQGIHRSWMRRTPYDFYLPEFANLSEQAIERAEIYASENSGENTTVFGFQGMYDELRYHPNTVHGLMRTGVGSGGLNFWHLGRIFDSAPELNTEFLECNPDKRCFAVPNQPGFIVSFGNVLKAVRPLPSMGLPGFVDHN